MHKNLVQEIAQEISALQSKLGLLRSELYRSKERLSHKDENILRTELAEVESKIDELQMQYKARKEAVND